MSDRREATGLGLTEVELPDFLPCPFCGSDDIDPKAWLTDDDRFGPGCDSCGATAGSVEIWNTRAARHVPSGDLREAVREAAELLLDWDNRGYFNVKQSEALRVVLAHVTGSLQHELDWLYSQERNVELSSFWDAGWRLRLGDETNGFTSNDRFDSLDDIAEYLRERRITPPTETT